MDWRISQPHYSLTSKPLISAFFVCISFVPTQQRGSRNGELSRADYMCLACKSTPVLVKDGSYSLFSLNGRRASAAPCLGLSHGYWVSQLTLCFAEPWKSSLHLPPSSLQDVRHEGHSQRHKGICCDHGTFKIIFYFEAIICTTLYSLFSDVVWMKITSHFHKCDILCCWLRFFHCHCDYCYCTLTAVLSVILITVLSDDKLFPAAITRGHYTALYTSGLYNIIIAVFCHKGLHPWNVHSSPPHS